MRKVISGLRAGFTLLEILLVIALIGLLGGFLLTDWGNVADSFGRRGWQQSIEESFRRGHFLAETGDRAIRLRFDPETRQIKLEDGEGGSVLEVVDLQSVEEIRSLSPRSTGGSFSQGISGGNPDYFSVRFGRDGSAEVIAFEVVRGGGSSVFHNHPFSGRLIVGEPDEGALGR